MNTKPWENSFEGFSLCKEVFISNACFSFSDLSSPFAGYSMRPEETFYITSIAVDKSVDVDELIRVALRGRRAIVFHPFFYPVRDSTRVIELDTPIVVAPLISWTVEYDLSPNGAIYVHGKLKQVIDNS